MSFINPDEEVEQHFGRVAALIGERSRAIMLWNLLDGRAYTATELASCANISKQACSSHLNLLLEAGILVAEKQGRHRYFTFASDGAASVIESIASLMPRQAGMQITRQEIPQGMRYARTCYDHLAGRAGVIVFQALIAQNVVVRQDERLNVSPEGESWLKTIGIHCEDLRKGNRQFAYACMDWSERKHHLGGALAAAMLEKFIDRDWIRRNRESREVLITPKGKLELSRLLGIDI